MLYSPVLTAGLLAASVSAFPFIPQGLNIDAEAINAAHEKRVNGLLPGFDAEQQLIDVSGEHAWVAPDFAAGDIRGPCPGLNALANHGYLPHNGVANQLQFIDATTKVYGMGVDLAAFLSALGAALDGDGVSWSIGGPTSSLLDLGDGLLGQARGISGSHNKYEADSSPTRGDLYLNGNDYKVQLKQFTEMYALQKDAAEPNWDLEVLGDFRSSRWDQSVSTNPYFFNGAFTGILVSQAGFTFIYRFMGNKSAEYPEGILGKETLKSFFAIEEAEDGTLTHNEGYERIPENWYKRAVGDEYTIPFFNLDAVGFVLRYPKIASVGGNTGTVNSFTGLNVTDLTAGVLNAETLTKDNNLACFALQAATQGVPDLALSITTLVGNLTSAVGNAVSALSCPKLPAIDKDQFSQYPGYSKLSGDGSY